MNIKHEKKNINTDFTTGTVLENVLRLGIPMTVALIINVLYSVVDRMYIGHMPVDGRSALTGIGIVFPIICVITAFQNLFGAGGISIFSIARGAGNRERASQIMHNSFFSLTVCGAALMLTGYLIKNSLLWKIGASEETYHFANDYLSIYLAGTMFVMIALGMNGYITAQGFAKTGMLTVAIGAIVNIVLDPIFIFVLDMGVRGAAIATVIGQFFSALWVMLFLTGARPEIRLRMSGFIIRFSTIADIMKLGVTEFTFQLTNSAVSFLCNIQLQNLGGDVWVSCMTVISSLREIVFSLVHGLTGAAKPVLGYNYGAKRYDRAMQTIDIIFRFSGVYLIICTLLLELAPDAFIRIFNSSPEILQAGRISVRIFFSLSIFMTFQLSGQNTFVALGRAKEALIFSLLRKVILLVPLVLLLPCCFNPGVIGVFAAEPVSELIGGSACYITMRLTVYRQLKSEAKKLGQL